MRYSGSLAGDVATAQRDIPSHSPAVNERKLPAPTPWAAALAALAGAALVGALAIPLCIGLNIWLDEAFTLHTTASGPLFAWSQAIVFEDQPPFYFLVEALWRMLDENSIVFARLPSVFFAALTVAVMVGAAYRMLPRVPPLTVALTTALNPMVIWAATEMRVYALGLLAGALLTWTFYEGFVATRPSRTAQIVYTVAALLGLYTQYYTGFFLAAGLMTLVVLRRGSLRAFGISMAVVAAGFLPFARVPVVQTEGSGMFVKHGSLFAAAHDIANAIFVFVLPHEPLWSGVVKYLGFGAAALLVVVLFAIGRPRLPRDPALRAMLLQWGLLLAVLSLAFFASGSPFDPTRHVIFAFAPTVLVVFGFMRSLRRARAVLSVVALLAFAMYAGGEFWDRYHPPLSKPGDWPRVVQALAADHLGTPIAIFPSELALPLHVYFPAAKPIAIPRPMPFTIAYVQAMTLESEADVARVLDPVRARSQHLWLVGEGDCGAGKLDDLKCAYLEAYLARRYRLIGSVAYNGALVRLFERADDERPAAIERGTTHAGG